MLILMIFLIGKIGKFSGMAFKAQQQSLGAVNGFIEEMIEGQKVVKVFTRENQVKEDFDKLGIYDEQEQLEILNSLLQLAIITQNNYNNIYQDSDDKANSTIQQVR